MEQKESEGHIVTIFGFEIVRDTMFLGNFSKEAILHTIENSFKAVGIFIIMFSVRLDVWWLMLIGVPFAGFSIIADVPKGHKDWRIKLW